MIKKVLASCLAVITVLGCTVISVGADGGYTVQQQAEVLRCLDVIQGDPDGNLRLDDYVTRAEFTKMAIAMSQVRNSVASELSVSPFKDVTYSHWAAPYVRLAVTSRYVSGYSDSTFRPDNNVTFAEATTIALKLLGYTDDDFGASWPYGQMGTAKNLGLTDGISGDPNSAITRGGCVILLNNLLDTKMKSGSGKYASVMDCEVKENIILVATNSEDAGVPKGKVYTTAGTYKLPRGFDHDNIGARGDIIVRNGDEIISFIPESGKTAEKLVVYSALGNVVIGYKDGKLTQENIPSSTTAYVGASATTFSSAQSKLSMGSVITILKDSSGSIEYVNVNEGATLQGPAIVSGGAWYSDYCDSISGYAVIRNGAKSSVSALQTNDVAYFAPDLSIMFVYANAKTGIYESASPNKDMPTTVTVSGVTYVIEGAQAFNALSSTGDIEYGDTVTILLGKDGKAAGAVSSTTSSSSLSGYLVGAGRKNFTDEDGDEYSSYYIEVVAPDGTKGEYVTKTSYTNTVNRIVNVTLSGGKATVSSVKQQSTVSGYVNAESKTIGSHEVADGVNILEVSAVGNSSPIIYGKTYLKRLNGVTLSSDDILYYSKNSEGKIDSLIIEDVTGDIYSYGIVTGADKDARVFTYDIGGTSYTVNGSYTAVSKGMPAKFEISGGSLSAMKSLLEASGTVESIDNTTVTMSNGKTYTLSDQVAVYSVQTGTFTYKIMPIKDLTNNMDAYNVYAYYDSVDKNGGRVRVLVANEK